MAKSDLMDFTIQAKIMTAKAVLTTNLKEENVWLPLSLIEINETTKVGIYEVTMPEWLAIDKGLI